MAVFLDVVCTDRNTNSLDQREQTVRAIGEILPFVIAKYSDSGPQGHSTLGANHGRVAHGGVSHSRAARFKKD